MASGARVTAVVLFVLASACMFAAVFAPWWAFDRNAGSGSCGWEDFGPFHRDGCAKGGQFKEEVGWLGYLALGTLLPLAAATVFAAAGLANRGSFAWVFLFTIIVLAVGALALFTAFDRLPDEAKNLRGGYDLGFFGSKDCRAESLGTDTVEVCAKTRVRAGWFLALAGSVVLPLAGLVSGSLRRSASRSGVPAPVTAPPAEPPRPMREPSGPARAAPRTSEVAAVTGRTHSMKCPQCQTRLAYTRVRPGPVAVRCFNCGRTSRV